MEKLNKIYINTMLGTSLVFITTSVFAAGGYLDYRNEYLTTTRVDYDRAKMGYFFDNGFNVHLEIMWKSGDHKEPVKNANGQTTKPANRDRMWDFENNGSGIILNYNYTNPDFKSWVFIPTFSLYTSSYWTTYEPGLEVNYKITPQYVVRGRIRFDFDKPTSTNTSDDQMTTRYDFWFDWKPQSLPIAMTYNFVWYDTETIRWNNKTYDWAQEIKFTYMFGEKKSWRPYLGLGDVKGPDKYDDNRQFRIRTGLTYVF